MNSYLGNFGTLRHSRKNKKILIAAVTVIAIVLLVVMAIGIIAEADNERSREISAAIAENTQLKQTVIEQQEQIESLSAEIEELKAKIPPEVIESYLSSEQAEEPSQYPENPRAEMEQ